MLEQIGKQLFAEVCHGVDVEASLKNLDDAGLWQLNDYLSQVATGGKGIAAVVDTMVQVEAAGRFFDQQSGVSNEEAVELGEEAVEKSEGFDSAMSESWNDKTCDGGIREDGGVGQ